MCLPERCPALTEQRDVTLPGNVTPDAASVPAALGLDSRGSRLWLEMTAAWTPSPIHREQLVELCRIADRLEKLDRQLKGEGWLRFHSRTDDGSVVEVIIDKVLTESREQATAYRLIAADLVKAAGAQKSEPKGGGVLDALAAKRAARSTSTAG